MSSGDYLTRPEQTAVPVVKEAEVVVVGGGPGGLGAAVGAARAGARTLLVERYGCLGGMATVGLVNPFMSNEVKGQPLDSGVFLDWCRKMEQMGGLGPHGHIFNPEVAKLAAEELCLEAGVELLYHATFDQPVMDGRRIEALLFTGKSGTIGVRGQVYVDATGDADVAARAGCGFELGRPEDGLCQPMTTCFDIGGVDRERMPDRAGINELYEKAKAEGRLGCPRENCLWFPTLQADRIHFNTTRVVKYDATDTLSLSEAEIEARRQVREFVAWLREDVPGFENSYLLAVAFHIGVRESRRVLGVDYLTREQAVACSKFADAICRCRYPIDIHSPTGGGTELVQFPPDDWYEIPYGCIVARDADNLLIGGRPISVDHAVHASMRVMPPACTVGQAAGVAAALACQQGVPPREVDGREVRARLIEQGVALGDL